MQRFFARFGSCNELRERSILYEYVDPKLEGLNAAQKQLLRMGPKNAALVAAKLREVEAALR